MLAKYEILEGVLYALVSSTIVIVGTTGKWPRTKCWLVSTMIFVLWDLFVFPTRGLYLCLSSGISICTGWYSAVFSYPVVWQAFAVNHGGFWATLLLEFFIHPLPLLFMGCWMKWFQERLSIELAFLAFCCLLSWLESRVWSWGVAKALFAIGDKACVVYDFPIDKIPEKAWKIAYAMEFISLFSVAIFCVYHVQ